MSEFKEELKNDVLTDSGLEQREQYFLDILFDECGGDVPRAMKKAGYPPSVSTNTVRKKLKAQILEISKDYIASSTPKASYELVNIFNDPTAPGAKTVLAAAKEVLDRGGVNKEETPTGPIEQFMFILPPKVTEDE
jgi:hypothetical protein